MVSCNTNKATRSKTEEINFQFGGHEVLQFYALCNTSRPHSNVFQAANQYILVEKIRLLFHQKTALCCMLSLFHVKVQ